MMSFEDPVLCGETHTVMSELKVNGEYEVKLRTRSYLINFTYIFFWVCAKQRYVTK